MQRINKQRSVATIGHTLLLVGCLIFGLAESTAIAAPRTTKLQIVPTITHLAWNGSQLLASGTATAVIKGKTQTASFSNVPVNLSLASNQTGGSMPGPRAERPGNALKIRTFEERTYVGCEISENVWETFL